MRLVVIGILAASMAISGCGAFGATPSLPLVCNAISFGGRAVLGHVRATPDETWLEAEDGRHLSIEWPEEVEIRPDGLYNRASGEPMVRDGGLLQLIQTEWTSAAGTPA